MTFYVWRKTYANRTPSEMGRLKQLGDENGWLIRIVADLTLDRKMLQDHRPKARTCPVSSARGSSAGDLASQHSTGVRSAAGGTFERPCQ